MLKEKDCLGEMEIPEDVYYGIQTERARNNFGISGSTIDDLPDFIRSIAEIKKAAALANAQIGKLDLRQTQGHVPHRRLSRRRFDLNQHECQRGHCQAGKRAADGTQGL